MKNTDLGKRLKKVRLEKGYTQEILAEKISTTASYISDIERGVKTPSLNTFIVIINALAGRTYKAVMTATIYKDGYGEVITDSATATCPSNYFLYKRTRS